MYRFPVWSDGCCWELTESFHITQNAIYKRNAGEECDDFFYEFIREKFLDGKYFFLSFIRTGGSEQINEGFFLSQRNGLKKSLNFRAFSMKFSIHKHHHRLINSHPCFANNSIQHELSDKLVSPIKISFLSSSPLAYSYLFRNKWDKRSLNRHCTVPVWIFFNIFVPELIIPINNNAK